MARCLIVPDAADGNDSQSPRSRSWSDYLSLSKSSGTRANLVYQSAKRLSLAPETRSHSSSCAETLISLRLVALLGLCSLCFDTLRMVWRYNKPRQYKPPFESSEREYVCVKRGRFCVKLWHSFVHCTFSNIVCFSDTTMYRDLSENRV